jgi:hypothetical protein
MDEEGNTRGTGRYIALDIHNKYCVIGGVDRDWKAVPVPKTTNQKRLGAYNIRPLLIFSSCFDLLVPYPLTLLLIGSPHFC